MQLLRGARIQRAVGNRDHTESRTSVTVAHRCGREPPGGCPRQRGLLRARCRGRCVQWLIRHVTIGSTRPSGKPSQRSTRAPGRLSCRPTRYRTARPIPESLGRDRRDAFTSRHTVYCSSSYLSVTDQLVVLACPGCARGWPRSSISILRRGKMPFINSPWCDSTKMEICHLHSNRQLARGNKLRHGMHKPPLVASGGVLISKHGPLARTACTSLLPVHQEVEETRTSAIQAKKFDYPDTRCLRSRPICGAMAPSRVRRCRRRARWRP